MRAGIVLALVVAVLAARSAAAGGEGPFEASVASLDHRARRPRVATARAPVLDRSDVRPGMIVPDGIVLRAFRSIGWGWGGSWTSSKDYQHLSANGS